MDLNNPCQVTMQVLAANARYDDNHNFKDAALNTSRNLIQSNHIANTSQQRVNHELEDESFTTIDSIFDFSSPINLPDSVRLMNSYSPFGNQNTNLSQQHQSQQHHQYQDQSQHQDQENTNGIDKNKKSLENILTTFSNQNVNRNSDNFRKTNSIKYKDKIYQIQQAFNIVNKSAHQLLQEERVDKNILSICKQLEKLKISNFIDTKNWSYLFPKENLTKFLAQFKEYSKILVGLYTFASNETDKLDEESKLYTSDAKTAEPAKTNQTVKTAKTKLANLWDDLVRLKELLDGIDIDSYSKKEQDELEPCKHIIDEQLSSSLADVISKQTSPINPKVMAKTFSPPIPELPDNYKLKKRKNMTCGDNQAVKKQKL